jgi:type II secretory pathway component GspD/PulD (secretin)
MAGVCTATRVQFATHDASSTPVMFRRLRSLIFGIRNLARSLVHAFERQTGADILATPRVTTLNNRQANVEVDGTGDSDVGDAKLGPSLDVMPVVSADWMTINLLTTAHLELTSAQDDTGPERKQVLQTAVSGNAVLMDGQTAVFCQWVGRSENGNAAPVENPACLVVLVTPTSRSLSPVSIQHGP